MKSNIFFTTALREIPRLLGQIDRNPLSPTYGSCDRAFWHYRTNDISCARYQELALTLALLYSTDFSANPYHNDENILALANAVIAFTCRQQHIDGSYDEWYLNEGSFVCTAFVSAALAQTALILGDKVKDKDFLVRTLQKAGKWLMARSETLVVNQLTGAILALATIGVVTKDEIFTQAAGEKCRMLLSLQDSEGWWSEYGGPDIGYLSLAIDYLSQYARLTGNVEVWPAIERASSFISHFVHPDGTAGGEYMSRNTEYLIPSGFIRAADYCPAAQNLALMVEKFHCENKGILPQSLDDRYICYILYNWLQAGILWDTGSIQMDSVVASRSQEIYFAHSGLFVKQNDAYQLFVNLKKGGSFRLYSNNTLLLDSGIALRFGKRVYMGNMFNLSTTFSYDASTKTLRSRGELVKIKIPLLTTGPALILKTLQFTMGWLPLFQRWLKFVLRIVSVMRPGAKRGSKYRRTIIFSPNSVTVVDVVNKSINRESFVVGIEVSHALVPSSRYVTVHNALPALTPTHSSFDTVNDNSQLTRVFAL